jgi:hypothetical protein
MILAAIDTEMVKLAEEYLAVAGSWALQASVATISGMLALSFIVSIFRD